MTAAIVSEEDEEKRAVKCQAKASARAAPPAGSRPSRLSTRSTFRKCLWRRAA